MIVGIRYRVIRSSANRRIGVSALRPVAASRAVRGSSMRGRSSAAATGRSCRSPTPDTSSPGSIDGITLTEVAAAAQHPLPQRRRLMSHRLKGTCSDELECRGGVTYQVEFSLEPVEKEAFWTYQKELTQAGARQGLLHCFEAERPVRPRRDELHQSRIARPQPARCRRFTRSRTTTRS